MWARSQRELLEEDMKLMDIGLERWNSVSSDKQ